VTVSGELEPYPASVAGQLVGVRLRLLEYERKVRHDDELAERIEQLEAAATPVHTKGMSVVEAVVNILS